MGAKPLRFIHTSDWHLGLRARFVPGDAGAAVREARFETVARIGKLARERGAAFVLVAGDVFDHLEVSPETLRKACDVLAEFDRPVYLLPGNHDPWTPHTLYDAPLWRKSRPEHVHVLREDKPFVFEEFHEELVTLFTAPIRADEQLADPFVHMRADLGPEGGFRIGCAHGGDEAVLARLAQSEEGTTERRDEDRFAFARTVPRGLPERAKLDYLALGDWHSVLEIEPRTWYSGSPEATKFNERDPGKVLLVEIERPGALPTIEPIEVSTHTWLRERRSLASAADLDALGRWLEALPNKRKTLCELELEGALGLELFTRLECEMLNPFSDRLRFLRVRRERLVPKPGEADLEAFSHAGVGGWLAEAIEALRRDAETHSLDADALALLYRLHREIGAS